MEWKGREAENLFGFFWEVFYKISYKKRHIWSNQPSNNFNNKAIKKLFLYIQQQIINK